MVADAGSPNPIFYLPDLGEGLEEAELIEWCVRVGQSVQENDVLAKMETAKALVEIPSPRGGVIGMLHGKPGQAIKVGAPLVTFGAPSPTKVTQSQNGGTRKSSKKKEKVEQPDSGTVVGNLDEASSSAARDGGTLAAPAVRRLARELGVDLAQVSGTGIGGRITAHDVESAAHEADQSTVTEVEHADRPATTSTPARVGSIRIPFRGVRRTIAEHLRFSVTHAVHYTVMDQADVTALDTLRRRLVAASNEKISLLPFVAVAVCHVLSGRRGAKFARLNSTVDDEKQEIVQHSAVHLGIATDTESGLMVPVIRDAEHLGVIELARRIAQLARGAHERTLSREELSGSTFTLSNVGPMGGQFATPIINYPEAAILAIGRAREGVVVRDGMLGVGKVLPLSLSADHRVIDGGTATSALAKIIDLLQTPEELLPPGRER